MNIISCIGSYRASNNLLPHFLNHYKEQFPECKFHVILHVDPSDEEELKIFEINKSILINENCIIHEIWEGSFTRKKIDKILNIIKMDFLYESWCAVFDVDEFVFFPDNLDKLKKIGIDSIKTVFVDMISESDSNIQDNISIFDQFPIPSQLTANLLEGQTNKRVIFWNDKNLMQEPEPTNHSFNESLKTLDCFYLMYHFKWDSSVKNRLKKRIKNFKTLEYGNVIESERFLESSCKLKDYRINSVGEIINCLGPSRGKEKPKICDSQSTIFKKLMMHHE